MDKYIITVRWIGKVTEDVLVVMRQKACPSHISRASLCKQASYLLAEYI